MHQCIHLKFFTPKEKLMAIQHNITEEASEFGIAFNNAYYRIISFNMHRRSDVNNTFWVAIQLVAYATSSPSDSTREIDLKNFHASLEDIEAKTGDTFLAKCYAWVMDQDDMAGSTAV